MRQTIVQDLHLTLRLLGTTMSILLTFLIGFVAFGLYRPTLLLFKVFPKTQP